MSFLSPDDTLSGLRRKSLCNGGLSLLSNKQNPSSLQDLSKTKNKRRRGSFNEIFDLGGSESNVIPKSNSRRSSLVSR